jgi:spore coat polysaccharide biosynthesis protein SpsF
MDNNRKIAATIQARMGSSRLPGKVLMEVLDKPLLYYMVERLRKCKKLDDVILATTTNPKDDVLADFAEKNGLTYYRGSEEDVLSRVLETAQTNGVDIIVETTGDCPLIDPVVVDKVVELYLENDYDYVSNTVKRTFPRGMDTQVFATEKLAEIDSIATDPADREHVSLYFYEVEGRYKLGNLDSNLPEKYWDARLTVDTPEDFQLIREIFERLYPANNNFLLPDIISLLEEHPELMEINRDIEQKKVR